MNQDIIKYNERQSPQDKLICDYLAKIINDNMTIAENKVWHAHLLWFINGNPIVGYSKQKLGVRLMFWSGADFEEEGFQTRGAKFKDASIFYNSLEEIKKEELERWLEKSKSIQWDYKNIVKRKGLLERIE